MSADAREIKRDLEQKELKDGKDSAGDSKRRHEKKLLKDVPGVAEYLDGANLDILIDEPLRWGDQSSNQGRRAIHFACENFRSPDLLELLLKHGADPNVQLDSTIGNGDTPLMYAVRGMPAKSIALLIEAGADIFARNTLRRTVFDCVATQSPWDPTVPVNLQNLNMAENDEFRVNFLPFLAAIYKACVINEPNTLFCDTRFPRTVIDLILEYDFPIEILEKITSIIEADRARQKEHNLPFNSIVSTCKNLLGQLKRAHDAYERNRKMEKLAKLSDTQLDRLLILAGPRGPQIEAPLNTSAAGGAFTLQYSARAPIKADPGDRKASEKQAEAENSLTL